MVYIHFPSNLTEEELMLQTKYQKLKKKKKALQAHKAPKQEQEKPLISKRPADARDAREVARKLIKSGAIQAIQRPQTKQDQTSFKRPKGQDRKRVSAETNSSASYQPFSSTQSDGFAGAASDSMSDPDANRVHNLYQQFATERDREERGLVDKSNKTSGGDGGSVGVVSGRSTGSGNATPDGSSPKSSASGGGDNLTSRADKPRSGNTIYVAGTRVSEEFLKTHFSTFGQIVNISMEHEKSRGFITFNKPESAERAIVEMDSKPAAGIQLVVTLARRQPQIAPINDASSSAAWATIATSHSQKGSHKGKREMVTYDEDTFCST